MNDNLNNFAKILKYKFSISIGTFVFGVAFSGVLIFAIGSNSEKIKYEQKNPDGMQYISERTFSLELSGLTLGESGKETGGKQLIYGTGWLLAKDTTAINDFTYFLATNLHVASAIQNSGKKYFIQNEYGIYEEKTGPVYTKISFGQVGKMEGDVFKPGVQENHINSSQVNFYRSINFKENKEYVQIAYTSFDMFKNSNIQYWTEKEKAENQTGKHMSYYCG